jgi:hypothetical protein
VSFKAIRNNYLHLLKRQPGLQFQETLIQSVMWSLVIQPFPWHWKTRPIGNFSLGIVFLCKKTYFSSFHSSARTLSIMAILGFSLPVHLIKTIFTSFLVQLHSTACQNTWGWSLFSIRPSICICCFLNFITCLWNSTSISAYTPGSLWESYIPLQIQFGHFIMQAHRPLVGWTLPVFVFGMIVPVPWCV